MQFELTAEQKLIVETVRRFVETELIPLEEEIETTGELSPPRAARAAVRRPAGIESRQRVQW